MSSLLDPPLDPLLAPTPPTSDDAPAAAPARPLRPAAARGRSAGLPELWRSRELLGHLVLRNLRVKYQRSVLGFVWTLLNPLLTITVLVLVFHFVVKIQVPDFWAFLVSGYFVWSFSLQSLTAATYVLPEHAHLWRSMAFPGEVLVVATALSRMAEFLAEMVLVVALLAVFHHHRLPASFLWLVPLLLLVFALAVGLSLPIATLAAFFHDVQHALPIALMTLFYVSPVFYPARMVPAAIRPLYFANPFAGLITLFQTVLFEGRAPDAGLLLWTAALIGAILWFGHATFRRYQPILAEIV
jgi:ABC-type polysaccharide/polyol phosphate export permease